MDKPGEDEAAAAGDASASPPDVPGGDAACVDGATAVGFVSAADLPPSLGAASFFLAPPPCAGCLAALAARCCSCKARRSALLSLGFLGGITSPGGGPFFSFFSGGSPPPVVAAAASDMADEYWNNELTQKDVWIIGETPFG